MWQCRKCHEKHEDTFDVCWNCGTSIDGTEDPNFQNADLAMPVADLRETPAEKRSAVPDRPMVCPKCKSRDVMPGVRILAQAGQFGAVKGNLEVEVYEDPGALIFKGAQTGTLTASVCGNCGYTELYVNNPAQLLAVYRKSKNP